MHFVMTAVRIWSPEHTLFNISIWLPPFSLLVLLCMPCCLTSYCYSAASGEIRIFSPKKFFVPYCVWAKQP